MFYIRFFLSLNSYSITLTLEEGNGSVELVTNGRNIQVNEVNVYDYVRLYANYRLIKTHEKSLEVSWKFENISSFLLLSDTLRLNDS